MYEQVFGLTSRPFTATPYIKHYVATQPIQQALEQTRLCIERASGPAIIIGQAGSGKSLFLAMIADQYRSLFHVVNLACARLDERRDLLQTILFELNQPYRGLAEGELRLSLIDYLKPSEQCPNGILLLVDDAHLLPAGLLDELRLITNFVREGQPRVRLVMGGTQQLEDHLNDTKLESFNQRIAVRGYLTLMSHQESRKYIRAHLERAGGTGRELFTDSALRAVCETSDGCPRLINQICDHSLVLAAAAGATTISEPFVRQAWADLQNFPTWTMPDDRSANSVANAGQRDQFDRDQWTVIEFGQLEEEPLSAGGTLQTAADGPTSGEFETSAWHARDASVGIHASADPSSTWPSSKQTGHYDASDWGPDELPPTYNPQPLASANNPFDEAFVSEEQLRDQYLPATARHNLASLTLSDTELQSLNELPQYTQYRLPQIRVANEDFQAGISSDQFCDSPLDVTASLAFGADDGSGDIQNVVEDDSMISIQDYRRQLNSEIGINETGFAPAPVARNWPATFEDLDEHHATLHAGQLSEPSSYGTESPVDPQFIQQQIREQQELIERLSKETRANQAAQFNANQSQTSLSTEYPVTQHQSYQRGADLRANASTAGSEDDRDMLIVSHTEHMAKTPTTKSPSAPQGSPSTGRATRVEYRQLFDQLRNATDSNYSSDSSNT